MSTLNFVPASITVRTPVGASLSFTISVRHADGSPFDLSGYTVSAPFLQRDEFEPPVASWSVDQTDIGMLTLALLDTQTAELGAPFTPITWPWCVWIQNADARTQLVRGGLVVAA